MPSFAIINNNSGKVLDIPFGSPDGGIGVQQYTYNGGKNQLWNLVRCSDQPYFQIVSVATQKVLGVAGAALEDQAPVCQFTPADNPLQAGQAWRLDLVGLATDFAQSAGDGGQLAFAFKIVAVHSWKVLDVPGFSTADQTFIQQYSPNGGSNQTWLLAARS